MAITKPAPNLLTADQHEAFDLYVKEWQERLGLLDWRIERTRKKTKNMAEVVMDHKSRMANYRVGDFGATPVSPESIESTVVHELLHVLLYELVNQIEIGLTDVALESAEHRVVHVLEKLLLAPRNT